MYCNVLPHTKAIVLLERILTYTHNCVQNVFSLDAYSTETSDKTAGNCLKVIKTQSEKLFANLKQVVADIMRLKSKSNICTCCM